MCRLEPFYDFVVFVHQPQALGRALGIKRSVTHTPLRIARVVQCVPTRGTLQLQFGSSYDTVIVQQTYRRLKRSTPRATVRIGI
jgi:hypothetical protein